MTTTVAVEEQTGIVAVERTDVPVPPEAVEQDLLVEDVSIDGMCGVY